MAEQNGFGSFFVGFLAGACAGAIAAILYAPTAGEETRSTLRDKKDDFLEKANLSLDDAYKQAESAAKEARDRFDTLANTTRTRADEVARRGQVVLEERLSNLNEKAEQVEEILMDKVAKKEDENPEPEA